MKYTIYESQEARRQFTIPELFLIRMLLSYSKFSNSDYDWKGVISKVLKKFEEKDLNLYDLGLIMSLYYDGLRRFFEIKGKEQDFFNPRMNPTFKKLNLQKEQFLSMDPFKPDCFGKSRLWKIEIIEDSKIILDRIIQEENDIKEKVFNFMSITICFEAYTYNFLPKK